ncbi:hypothetical protein NBH00_13190 [Paraconexibacter antarcticus]|uniref:Uncharacterized protein n=1 Tax=Paraconexibacter antarcticus TaxID=2949664 RepID=A0ABY5DKQ7_9ACTN|nr:hypothetical protein [Paraconexibacter antarcticus]UTI62316.1 hypothetical protein NBH00_13190 [Paraconexibacter antarcticus]
MLAVLGLYDFQRFGAVGQGREVPPVRPQFGLRTEQPGAAHDQTLGADHRLRDLGLAVRGVVLKRLPAVSGIAAIAAGILPWRRTPIE